MPNAATSFVVALLPLEPQTIVVAVVVVEQSQNFHLCYLHLYGVAEVDDGTSCAVVAVVIGG